MKDEIKLIFDFDGVLGDTQEVVAQATSVVNKVDYEVAKACNLEYSSNKPNHTRGHSLTEDDLKRIYKWTTDLGDEMVKIGFNLFTDFVKEVESVKTEYKAIVSSGSQRYVLPAVAKTNINPTHVLAYENHHSKEEKIETICKDWGCSTDDVYYFTDTLSDVYELQNMITKNKLIGVAWGFCGKDLLLKELREEYILDVPFDLKKILK